MDSPLAKYITLAANDCGYGGIAEELIVSYVHPIPPKHKVRRYNTMAVSLQLSQVSSMMHMLYTMGRLTCKAIQLH
jgi:hypothetical protein